MKSIFRELRDCPNRDAHNIGPDGYHEWETWADEMSKTHEQKQCPGCTFWVIWEPKENTQEEVMPKTN